MNTSRQLKAVVFNYVLLLTGMFFPACLDAQITAGKDSISIAEKDIGDVFKAFFHSKTDTSKIEKSAPFAVLPTVSYNPSFGFVIGAKLSGIKQFGNHSNTELSSFGMEGIYTSKGIIMALARHNLFTAGNKWNILGTWQVSRFGVVDYGIGTGKNQSHDGGFVIDEFPTADGDSSFPIKYGRIRILEKVYRKIGKHLYAGIGLDIDMYTNIKDEKLSTNAFTPHKFYSARHGFNPGKYAGNGFLIALQYNTREHPVRSYGGIFADISLRFNQQWLGSTKNAAQLQYDFRKYWSLSKKHPEHVLAFWHWASYTLGGSLPYLQLPATTTDTYNRSGRAYTISRFKGPDYAYFESEYRFPITKNKLLSGVCFVNMQSASDDIGTKLFSSWAPGAGAGLRILFQKKSRIAVCIDYAKGSYGSSGIFFGLCEAF